MYQVRPRLKAIKKTVKLKRNKMISEAQIENDVLIFLTLPLSSSIFGLSGTYD